MELDKVEDDLCSDEDEDSACIFEQGKGRNHRRSKEQSQGPFLNFSRFDVYCPGYFKIS